MAQLHNSTMIDGDGDRMHVDYHNFNEPTLVVENFAPGQRKDGSERAAETAFFTLDERSASALITALCDKWPDAWIGHAR